VQRNAAGARDYELLRNRRLAVDVLGEEPLIGADVTAFAAVRGDRPSHRAAIDELGMRAETLPSIIGPASRLCPAKTGALR